MDPTTGNDDGASASAQQADGGCDILEVGTTSTNPAHLALEEGCWVVVSRPLYVLRKAQERQAAIGRIKHRVDRRGQRLNQLRGVSNTIPVAGHRFERVVDRHRWIVKVLQLLENRMG